MTRLPGRGNRTPVRTPALTNEPAALSLPQAAAEPDSLIGIPVTTRPTHQVGRGFISMYTLSFAGGSLVLIAPLLVTLALKVNDLVGIDNAPKNLALITGTGSLLAMLSNPVFGRLSDRTTSRLGMRRPWMLVGLAGGTIGTLIVALAPSIATVLVGWCLAQVFFNALLAAQAAVLPDQVPTSQRGLVSGALGICTPLASVAGTYLVQAVDGHMLAMFLLPCLVGGGSVVAFATRLHDRRRDRNCRPAGDRQRSFHVGL